MGINKILNLLQQKQLDAIIIANGYNIRYLSGFTGATGYLFISEETQVLLTDGRYTTQAREECRGVEVELAPNVSSYGTLLNDLLSRESCRNAGYEDQIMTCASFQLLRQACASVQEWIPLSGEVDRLRMIKTTEELDKIGAAQKIADQGFAHMLDILKPGMTELEAANELEYFLKKQGASGLSFETIMASGLHSAMPHAVPGQKKLASGDFVTMDFGCIYEGYCSDMTRTVVLGKANDRQKEIYDVVLAAQEAALDYLKAGVTGAQADAVARDMIAKAGYGEYFGHSLGHGVGLYIHEEPRLSVADKTQLEADMVVTVEPGIYIPDFGGVRIEDMIAVKENGIHNFASSTKELLEIC